MQATLINIMIISHTKKFIFIEIQKTASTSLGGWIINNLKESDVQRFIQRDKKYKHCWRHCTLKDVKLDFGNISNYYKSCIVRNPWGRVLSYFFYCKKHLGLDPDVSFKEFLVSGEYKLRPQTDFLDDEYKFDFIGKFENLEKDSKIICEKLKMTEFPAKKRHLLSSNKFHYAHYYNDETKKIVEEKYASDIEYFKYEF